MLASLSVFLETMDFDENRWFFAILMRTLIGSPETGGTGIRISLRGPMKNQAITEDEEGVTIPRADRQVSNFDQRFLSVGPSGPDRFVLNRTSDNTSSPSRRLGSDSERPDRILDYASCN
jgi:hypothetical protein